MRRFIVRRLFWLSGLLRRWSEAIEDRAYAWGPPRPIDDSLIGQIVAETLAMRAPQLADQLVESNALIRRLRDRAA